MTEAATERAVRSPDNPSHSRKYRTLIRDRRLVVSTAGEIRDAQMAHRGHVRQDIEVARTFANAIARKIARFCAFLYLRRRWRWISDKAWATVGAIMPEWTKVVIDPVFVVV